MLGRRQKMLEAELNIRSRPESLSSSTSFSMAGLRRICSSVVQAAAITSCASSVKNSRTCIGMTQNGRVYAAEKNGVLHGAERL